MHSFARSVRGLVLMEFMRAAAAMLAFGYLGSTTHAGGIHVLTDCESCDWVPCGMCQEGCTVSSNGCDPTAPGASSRNGCPNNNRGSHPDGCTAEAMSAAPRWRSPGCWAARRGCSRWAHARRRARAGWAMAHVGLVRVGTLLPPCAAHATASGCFGCAHRCRYSDRCVSTFPSISISESSSSSGGMAVQLCA